MYTLAKTLIYISYFSVLIPIAIYLVNFNRVRKERVINLLFIILLVAALADLTSYLFTVNGQSTIVLITAYFIINALLLGVLYERLLQNKILVYCLLAVYILFVGIFFLNEYENYNISWTVSGLIPLVLSFMLYKQLYHTTPVVNPMRYALFWINTAVYFYFSFNLLLFMISIFVFETFSPEGSTVYWSFHNVNNIIKNGMFAVGIYWARYKKG